METTRKPSVITVKFGDGYEQRRAGGLNADLKTFKLAPSQMNIPAPCWTVSFYPVAGCVRGARQNTTDRQVVCREWSTSDNAMYTDFNCTLEEVTH